MSTSLRAEVIKLLYFEVNKNKLLVLDYKSLLRVYQIALSSITKGNEDCRQPEQIWMSSRQVELGCEPRQGRAGVGDIFTHFIHLGEGKAFLSHRIRVLCYNLDQRPAKSIDGHLVQKFTEPLWNIIEKLFPNVKDPELSQPKAFEELWCL